MSIPSFEIITPEQLLQRLVKDNVRLIDVRAPVEFFAGSIPNSINLPILTDNERSQVGITYKQQGFVAATALGHRLVQGAVKEERVKAWLQKIKSHGEDSSILTCFRGGLRSQTAQSWIYEQGYSIPRLAGGYKKMRQLLTEELIKFCQSYRLHVLTGKTGSGKTQLLRDLPPHSMVDLEALAHHRGSAFGNFKSPQPSQADFENRLALTVSRIKHQKFFSPILVEDESRMIGQCVQPEPFFHLLRSSPVLILEEPLEIRVENTFREYVLTRAQEADLFADLKFSLLKIRNKLGGLRYQELLADMTNSESVLRQHGDPNPSRIWIEKLLVWYYDPAYEKSLLKRNPKIVFRGDSADIKEFLK